MTEQRVGRTEQISPHYLALRRILWRHFNAEEPWVLEWILRGTSEFDLNTLRVDGEIFESGKKKLRIQKYLDTCGRGLRPKAPSTRITRFLRHRIRKYPDSSVHTLSDSLRIYFFLLWRADLFFSRFAVEFAGCVWTVAVSGKKRLRIRKYPDMCGRGLLFFLYNWNLNIPHGEI